ncbi:MAG: monovalent cation/H(+) antiporter subunit G [Pseudomonadota bacterium]
MDLAALFAAASLGEIVASALVLIGAAFCLIAGIGVLRLPDVFMRMHASTKAGTLGAGLILIAAAVSFGTTEAAARALGAVVFILVTAPAAAHVIGRAAYLSGAPLSERTWIDERQAPGAAAVAQVGAGADLENAGEDAEAAGEDVEPPKRLAS